MRWTYIKIGHTSKKKPISQKTSLRKLKMQSTEKIPSTNHEMFLWMRLSQSKGEQIILLPLLFNSEGCENSELWGNNVEYL